MQSKRKVCHITTAHSRVDVRIFLKELQCLRDLYECHFIVADGNGDDEVEGIKIWDIGKGNGRFKRALHGATRAYRKALELNCELYHFHDPEFILAALQLRKNGKKVIYDIHEDVPRDVLSKEYLGMSRKLVSYFFEKLENFCAKRFSFLIAATPHIRDRFKKINPNTVDINNYPMLKDYAPPPAEQDFETRERIAYIGSISKIRGLSELICALPDAGVRLDLAGNFDSETFKTELSNLPGWRYVDYHGLVNRKSVARLLQNAVAGIVTFHPEPNHINAQPNKIFEYMSAGLPVICSNFEAWRILVGDNKCGILVDPMDPSQIATAIRALVNNKKRAKEMSVNGIRAVHQYYNWEMEQSKLKEVYQLLLK